ncbi:hypothetical protein LJC07_06405 [Christensenellaceae bacterium OttesenSCG-928-L17]|nr:hypothetical protein [Christensenellaceae bacterium OttesenSCG-928-L17]
MAKIKEERLPEEYRPLSMWAYFGYSVLYSVPIVGWVFLIVFALDGSNINRRNYSRSYFVGFILAAALFIVMLVSGTTAVLVDSLINR